MLLNDEELIQRFSETRDNKLYEELYQRHCEALKIFIVRRYTFGDVQAAEDVVQHTFLKVYEDTDMYNGEMKFKPWLFSVAANSAINVLKAKARRKALPIASIRARMKVPAVEPLDYREPELHHLIDSEEEAEKVRNALNMLPEAKREIILMIYREGLSERQAAKELGIARSTFKDRLSSSMSALRVLTDTGTISREAA